LLDLLFSGKKPQNADYEQYIGIFRNKRKTYDDVNKIRSPKGLEFLTSIW